MTTARDVSLARLALAAYSNADPPLPAGFTPLPTTALTLDPSLGASFVDGIYRNQNAAALVVTGSLNGEPTVVLAFRGSDDREDSINSLRDINADYPDFAPLVSALDSYVTATEVRNVAVTGHSLGGAMTQLYMSQHPSAATQYLAVTFGSPGALLGEGTDPRSRDYVIAGDPAVYLGENRAETGAELRANPLLAGGAAFIAADTFPGLTVADALASLPSLTRDYENRGITVLLPSLDGSVDQVSDFRELLRADPANHRIEVYTFQVASEAAGTNGRNPAPLFDRDFYLARNPDVAAAGVDAQTHYEQFGWREGRDPDAAFKTSFYLASNPDVAAAGVNPLEHYSIYGWREGRDPNPYFDPDFYRASNPDVAAAGVEPLLHYQLWGWMEGRDPGPSFSTSRYLAANPDVLAAGVDPLGHYLQFGIEEGRIF
ncbi:alpha/beta hydrolase family protein [Sabulicella glaciei]|uniref:Uncharacterized protein n=1 Tax=Sabulicella glaciei TaxID=2984948 RepID=A0ABT3P050_9PROT|nr:hypothetical protein [Roseococcus sp. MDT2-1-1]MCW8087802.1 hypothetical protein [Roseococcus sp. MDT2-1-1]